MSQKLRPKPELEHLLDEAAQLEAMAEQEMQQEPTYREHADLSYKLDIPRDVDGLVKLLEEQKKLEEHLNNLNGKEYEGWLPGLYAFAGGAIAAVSGLASTIYYLLHNRPVGEAYAAAILIGGSILTTAVVFTGDYYGRKLGQRIQGKSSKKKRFDQEKADQLQIKQNELLVVEKKLSHYEKSYNLGDIALVDDHELGYSLGKVIQNSKEELVLRRTYHKLNRNALEAVDNRRWEEYSEEKPIANIISILKPSTQLSADDLRYIDEKTPILCVPSEAYRPPSWSASYGFVDNKRTDDIFRLHTIRNFQGPGEDWFKFSQVQEGKINAYLLVPEINQRI